MKTTGNIGITIAVVTALLLAAACIGTYLLYAKETQKNKELETQLTELTKEEQRTAVMQRVNAQMEEIANEERRISDEQRESAEAQAKIAQQERQNAERERREADQERKNALLAEQKALEASEIAQSQRKIAEQQRAEAEYSKRITDTLSYITLGRSLGTVAMNQLQTGNPELADMLAYVAYLFTDRYHGNIHYPAVYQSLVATSQGKKTWNTHKGVVSSVEFYPNDNNLFLTASTYGEVMSHKMSDEKMTSKMLFSNSQYDFRDVYPLKNGDVYAVDRKGRVLVLRHNGLSKILVPTTEDLLLGVTPIGNQLLLVGEHTLSIIDTESIAIVKTRKVAFHIVYYNRYDNSPIAFDDNGGMHIVRSLDRLESSKVPYKGQVMAFASSKNSGIKAYGMLDGSIFLEYPNGKSVKLIGHRSRITKIKIIGYSIYSSSYDGTVNLWMADQEKIEPMTLFITHGWILDFTFDNKKQNFWAVDQKGNLTKTFISVPMMVDKLKNKLTRNFTREEWDYYIGKNVPYEKIINK